ncbi:MAG TPA: hypothetical protein VFF73_27335 [Planctomycetota bacterium]|nr:hypothetical protein [Planctomycetota bacterium]
MKLGEIGVGATFIAPDLQTKVDKVWIVQQRDGAKVRATRRDGRFAVFAADTDVKPGPRPHGRRNK